jgi:hypothetical protein
LPAALGKRDEPSVRQTRFNVDDLEFLKQTVPEFKGYREDTDRHDTDRRVRALLGGALAEMRDRLGGNFPVDASPALDDAIWRCEFPDQTFTMHLDNAEVDDALAARLAAGDRVLVELSQRAPSLEPNDVAAFLHEVIEAFERRSEPLTAVQR